jgi:hypothetical protein
MKTRVEKIGPEQAKFYLKKNTHNRPLSRFQVTKYATIMEQGRWQLNGEPIIIADDGTLLDGQHRLSAIVLAGVNVECLVVEGLSREVFATLGTGAKRNAGDVAAMLGCKNATWVGAALGCLHRLESGLIDCQVSIPNDKVEELIQRYPEVTQVVSDAGASAIKKILSIGVFAGFYIWLSRRFPAQASDFFEQLKSGVGLIAGSPVLLLRERLVADRNSKARLPQREIVALLIKAWNAHLTGKWPKILKYAALQETFPVIRDGVGVARNESVPIRKLAA